MQWREFSPVNGSEALAAAQPRVILRVARKGRLKQPCFRWNFDSRMPLDEMCREAARLGAADFAGVPPDQCAALKNFRLISMLDLGGGTTIKNGIIEKQLRNGLTKCWDPAKVTKKRAAKSCPLLAPPT